MNTFYFMRHHNLALADQSRLDRLPDTFESFWSNENLKWDKNWKPWPLPSDRIAFTKKFDEYLAKEEFVRFKNWLTEETAPAFGKTFFEPAGITRDPKMVIESMTKKRRGQPDLHGVKITTRLDQLRIMPVATAISDLYDNHMKCWSQFERAFRISKVKLFDKNFKEISISEIHDHVFEFVQLMQGQNGPVQILKCADCEEIIQRPIKQG